MYQTMDIFSIEKVAKVSTIDVLGTPGVAAGLRQISPMTFVQPFQPSGSGFLGMS